MIFLSIMQFGVSYQTLFTQLFQSLNLEIHQIVINSNYKQQNFQPDVLKNNYIKGFRINYSEFFFLKDTNFNKKLLMKKKQQIGNIYLRIYQYQNFQLSLSYYQKDEILIYDAEYKTSLQISVKSLINDLYEKGSIPKIWIEVSSDYIQVLPNVKYIVYNDQGYDISNELTLSQIGLQEYSKVIIVLDQLLFQHLQYRPGIFPFFLNEKYQIYGGKESLRNKGRFSLYDQSNDYHNKLWKVQFFEVKNVNYLMKKLINQGSIQQKQLIEQNSYKMFSNIVKESEPIQEIQPVNTKLNEIEQIIVKQVNTTKTLIKLETLEKHQNQEQIQIIKENKQILIKNFSQKQQRTNDNKILKQIEAFKYHKINEAIKTEIEENLKKKVITNPLQQVPQKLDVNNQELLMYVLADQFKQQKKTLYQANETSDLNIFTLQASFGEDTQESMCQNLTLQETPQISFDLLSRDNEKEKQFHKQIREILAKQYNVKHEDVNILGIENGSIKVLYKIVGNYTDEEKAKELTLQEINRQFPGCKPLLVINKYFQQIQLSPDDFDPNFNMEWNQFKEYEMRGPIGDQLEYYFPQGWKGYALKVLNKYQDGNDWLQMDSNPNQWHIIFHGTDSSGCKGIIQNGFRAGQRQAYRNCFDLRSKSQQKIGKGIYLSNHVEVCQNYSTETIINNEKYQVVFMSRVRPQALRQAEKPSDISTKIGQKGWDNDYFVVNKKEDIRPYRVLLKKV
ncbi:hypothetical protein pb186bvf_008292 [Paramecium bursaria]